ncbi:MAG: FAD-dependent oxidoreductase [Lachnospiraceae bacterium]|nr:FAD-dependent oxidoreductase [Lachnospiraceae bacterium]
MTNYVVIGSSAAGVNAIREIRKTEKDASITLISRDRDIYSRCILHEYLCGKRTLERLRFVESDFEDRYHVNWMKGENAIGLDREGHKVKLESGTEVPYDKLLIATGSHTFFPPIKGMAGASNMIGFRNIDDIEVLKEVAKTRKNIVVLGSGLVGIDCATGFLELGVKVTLVDFAGWLLNKQLDERAARTYIEAFKKAGVEQHYGVGVEEVRQNEAREITEVALSDGTVLACDYFVVTAGVRSNVEFLQDSGLELSRFGLVFDETGKTSDPDIYGAGDVSGLSPIWPVAVKEGMIAAANMVGRPAKMTDFFASKSTMSFLGIFSMSLGNVNPDPEDKDIQVEVLDKGDVYKKIVHKDGRIIGALLQGDIAYGGVLQQLIARQIDVRKVKKPIFDIDYSDFFHIGDTYEFYYE